LESSLFFFFVLRGGIFELSFGFTRAVRGNRMEGRGRGGKGRERRGGEGRERGNERGEGIRHHSIFVNIM